MLADRELALAQRDAPPPPGPGEVQFRVRVVGLNHIDVWGFRGMAFAKRLYPLSVGAEAAGEVVAVGDGVTNVCARRPRRAVRRAGLRHLQALPHAAARICARTRPACAASTSTASPRNSPTIRRGWLVKIPDGVDLRDAACVAVAYATVEHMLFDNAQLEPGETILVHAGGSGIGSIAIRIAKSLGCTVITTVGSADKAAKAKALGADHVINYREDRFEGVVRKLTAQARASTWCSSIPAPTPGTARCCR